MDFLQIRFGHLKLTSATPGLSNPCKLRFKSNIMGVFEIDICRIFGDTSGFKLIGKLIDVSKAGREQSCLLYTIQWSFFTLKLFSGVLRESL